MDWENWRISDSRRGKMVEVWNCGRLRMKSEVEGVSSLGGDCELVMPNMREEMKASEMEIRSISLGGWGVKINIHNFHRFRRIQNVVKKANLF